MKKKQILFGLFLMQTMSVMLFAEPMEYSSTDDKENRIAKFLQEPLPEDVEVSRQKVTKDQSVETALQQIADLRTKVLAQAAITNLFNVVSKNWKKSAKESYYLAYHDKCEGFCISQDTLSELVNDMRMKKNLPKIDFNVTTSVGKLNLPKTSSEAPTAIAKEVGKLPKVEEPAPVSQPAVEPVVVAPSSQDKGDADLVAFYQLKLPQDVVYKNAADEKVFEVGKGTKVFDLLNYLSVALKVDDTDESDVKEFLKNFVVSMSPNKGVTSDKLFNTVQTLKALDLPLKHELSVSQIEQVLLPKISRVENRALVLFYQMMIPEEIVNKISAGDQLFEINSDSKVIDLLKNLARMLAQKKLNEDQVESFLTRFVADMQKYYQDISNEESFKNYGIIKQVKPERLLKTVKELASLREDVAGQEQQDKQYNLNDIAEVRVANFLQEKLMNKFARTIAGNRYLEIPEGVTVYEALTRIKRAMSSDPELKNRGEEICGMLLAAIKSQWDQNSVVYQYYFSKNDRWPDGYIIPKILVAIISNLEKYNPENLQGTKSAQKQRSNLHEVIDVIADLPVTTSSEELLVKHKLIKLLLSGNLMTKQERADLATEMQDWEDFIEDPVEDLKILRLKRTADEKISYALIELGKPKTTIPDLLKRYNTQQKNNVVSNITWFLQKAIEINRTRQAVLPEETSGLSEEKTTLSDVIDLIADLPKQPVKVKVQSARLSEIIDVIEALQPTSTETRTNLLYSFETTMLDDAFATFQKLRILKIPLNNMTEEQLQAAWDMYQNPVKERIKDSIKKSMLKQPEESDVAIYALESMLSGFYIDSDERAALEKWLQNKIPHSLHSNPELKDELESMKSTLDFIKNKNFNFSDRFGSLLSMIPGDDNSKELLRILYTAIAPEDAQEALISNYAWFLQNFIEVVEKAEKKSAPVVLRGNAEEDWGNL